MNRAQHWANQETENQPVRENPLLQEELNWESDPLRWQKIGQDPSHQKTLQEIFDTEFHQGTPIYNFEMTYPDGRILTTETKLLVKRCWVAWVQDGNPDAPLSADLTEFQDLSEADQETNKVQVKKLTTAVKNYLISQNRPLAQLPGMEHLLVQNN